MIRNIYRRILAALALFTVELLLVWGIFIACIIGFLYLGSEVLQGDPIGLDEAAFSFAKSIESRSMDSFLKFITFFASQQFMIPIALLIIGYFLFVRKRRWHSLKVPAVALGSITLNMVLKYIFHRQRPLMPLVEASGLSFPSGHSMVAASFYGLAIYLVWKHVKPNELRYLLVVLLVLFVLLIGFSRVYLRVHYATDVLGGFAAGFLWVMLGIWFLRRLERFSRKEIAPVISADPDKY